MAKTITPAIQKIEKRKAKLKNHEISSSPAKEAWRRFKKNKLSVVGGIILILIILVAIFAPVIAPGGFNTPNYRETLMKPCAAHPFGTDEHGRDILQRIIWGARVSFPIGILTCIANLMFGGVLGAAAAYFGGRTDDFIMRIVDVFAAIPSTLMAIAITSSLGNTMGNLILAMAISFMPIFARTVRAAVLTVKSNDYIEAAKVIGASPMRQVVLHMLPNALGPIIVTATFNVASSILTVASLSYIGLGLPLPTPEWGAMLSAGREYITQYPHITIFPGLTIMVTVLALNLLGDGLRSAMDPRQK